MQDRRTKGLRIYTSIFIIYLLIAYIPLDGGVGFGVPKIILSATAIPVLFLYTFKMSKAMIIGIIYILYQYLSASFHPESLRWSTLFFSASFVISYICIYNLITVEKVFSIEYFIKLCKWAIMLFFVVCILQQFAIIVGIRSLPIINFMAFLDRGIGCNSLALEPSHFARYMLIIYYAYIKCSEYKRGEGAFTLKELFSGEYKWVTIRFLWMMLTMGSGTAFVCLILFSGYFVRKHNWYYVIPIMVIGYSLIQASGIEALDRATSTIEATSTFDIANVRAADGSASVRIEPVLNSLNADFTKFETWFGYGIDAGRTFGSKSTIFDDYGFILYLISLLFNFTCGYNFWSLATIFMFAGVSGGSGGNFFTAWATFMIITCVKYFYENKNNPEIYEEEDNDTDTNIIIEEGLLINEQKTDA